jgi:hypothetical protein
MKVPVCGELETRGVTQHRARGRERETEAGREGQEGGTRGNTRSELRHSCQMFHPASPGDAVLSHMSLSGSVVVLIFISCSFLPAVTAVALPAAEGEDDLGHRHLPSRR